MTINIYQDEHNADIYFLKYLPKGEKLERIESVETGEEGLIQRLENLFKEFGSKLELISQPRYDHRKLSSEDLERLAKASGNIIGTVRLR